jgi:hypothetical protein
LAVFDYGDVVHACFIFNRKTLDAAYHSAGHFITCAGYLTHRCVLKKKVGWPSLAIRREPHCLLFIYKALCGQIPMYQSSMLNFTNQSDQTLSHSHIRLIIPRTNSNSGKISFYIYAPDRWNKLQD